MKRIDFAPRVWPRWIGWGSLMCGVVAVGAVQYATAQLRAEYDRAVSARAAADLRPLASNPRAEGPSGSSMTAKHLERLRYQMSLPWQELFAALETPAPTGVHLLAVEPDPASGSVRLQAQASRLELVPGYLAHLGSQPGWSDCVLVSHRLMDPAQPQGAVRFVVVAQWKAAHE